MMRALFSGVSGLKAHQTRMDVIGNNIANVNTTGYKSKSMAFSDILYQTTQAATGSNVGVGKAGTNPRQIGLGVKTGAINTSITTPGGSQSTGNPFDLKIKGDSFFVVNDGTNTYFTKDGSFNVDNAGYLCMANTGYLVMGWLEDPNNPGTIAQGSVRPINIMGEEYATFDAASTTAASIYGILDKHDDQLSNPNGKLIDIQTYDARGYEYNLKFGIKPNTSQVESSKDTTNTEKLYQLPSRLKYEDVSELTFTTANGDELKSSGIPSTLVEALKKAATEMPKPAYRDKDHVAGTKDSAVITINDDFLTAYNITDLGTASNLKGAAITVNYSGDMSFVAYKVAADGTETSLGAVNISNEAANILYGAPNPPVAGTGTTIPTYNLVADTAGGLLVTDKVFSDGTPTQYEFQSVAADNTTKVTKTLKYDDIAKLLSMDASPKVQSQYTTTEKITTDSVIDGSFTITLLGMTDSSDGTEVDISNIGDTSFAVEYDTDNGKLRYVGAEGSTSFTLNLSTLGGEFSNVTFDMSNSTNVDNGGKSTMEGLRDDGRKVGTRTGVSIGTDGTVTINYSNGQMRDIAQIAVAMFDNPMGLQNEGDNCYSTTANSGGFNGVGVDISANGDYMTSGVLEMSNVDLSQEFTDMITTQRGFQANSRIITVSDSILEELVNLKR